MRFACLGSGSRGNAWVVEAGDTRLMLDCGFGFRETERRLGRLGLSIGDVSGLLLTHEHTDHVRGAASFAARSGCPVWLTHGCLAMLEAAGERIERVHLVDTRAAFPVDGAEVTPYPVPHDAREPIQFVVSDGRVRFGLLTDAGHVTDHMQAQLDGCDALAVECNHDIDTLRGGSYPVFLKERILGRYGHLDNEAAAGLVEGMHQGRLKHVVAAHLSEENNTPELAQVALARALGCDPDWVGVADQITGLGWRDIS
jgi:phosphoribosyl 1,2-cyclic phosphodiesterase